MTSAPPSGTMGLENSDLREGLPPCTRQIVFDGRTAFFIDGKGCEYCEDGGPRFLVGAGQVATFKTYPTFHDGTVRLAGVDRDTAQLDFSTDDEAEAEAAWVRAEHFVRTEELI